jgi:hypothetical protein
VAFTEVRAFLRKQLIDSSQAFPLHSKQNAIDPVPLKDNGCADDLAQDHSHS